MTRRTKRGKAGEETEDGTAPVAKVDPEGVLPSAAAADNEVKAEEAVVESPPSKKRKAGEEGVAVEPSIKTAEQLIDDNSPELLQAENESPASWNQHLVDFILYKSNEGTVHVSPGNNKDLHTWVVHQRRLYAKHGKQQQPAARDMDPAVVKTIQERLQVLETIHFPLTTRGDDHWMRFYEKLQVFKANHGHLLVPRLCEIPGLGDWVTDQRRQNKYMMSAQKTTLDPARKKMLDDLGFVWQVRGRPGWDDRLEELVEYKKKNGDCKVPQHYKENPALGKWVAKQREQFKLLNSGKHSFLSADRLEKLRDVGFVWSIRNEKTKYDDIITVLINKNEVKKEDGADDAEKDDKSKSPKKGDKKKDHHAGDDDKKPAAAETEDKKEPAEQQVDTSNSVAI